MDMEVTSSTPLREEPASSMTFVTSSSTVSGSAPGYMATTISIGISILGVSSSLKPKRDEILNTTSARMISTQETGRFKAVFVKFIRAPPILLPHFRRPRASVHHRTLLLQPALLSPHPPLSRPHAATRRP